MSQPLHLMHNSSLHTYVPKMLKKTLINLMGAECSWNFSLRKSATTNLVIILRWSAGVDKKVLDIAKNTHDDVRKAANQGKFGWKPAKLHDVYWPILPADEEISFNPQKSQRHDVRLSHNLMGSESRGNEVVLCLLCLDKSYCKSGNLE